MGALFHFSHGKLHRWIKEGMDEISLLMKPQLKVTEDFSFMNPKVREQVRGEGLGVEKIWVLSQPGKVASGLSP